jgi:hypothetical protein
MLLDLSPNYLMGTLKSAPILSGGADVFHYGPMEKDCMDREEQIDCLICAMASSQWNTL